MATRGRPTRRDQIESVNRSLRTWGAAFGKPEVAERLVQPVPPKRDQVKRPVDGRPAHPYERDIVDAIMKALKRDPRVGFVWRQTSGTFQDGDRYIQAGPKGMPDICGVLMRGQFFGIEVKRPGKQPDERQAQRLEHLRNCGAIAGCAHSVEEAMVLLP